MCMVQLVRQLLISTQENHRELISLTQGLIQIANRHLHDTCTQGLGLHSLLYPIPEFNINQIKKIVIILCDNLNSNNICVPYIVLS